VIEPAAPYARSPQVGVEPSSWAPFPVGGAPPAARSAEGAPFVFHDAAGRRWPRIKRVVLAAAVALVALIGAVLLAAAHVAPGKAPWFSATAPQPVSDWPGRAAAGDPSAGPPGVAARPGGIAAGPATGAVGGQGQPAPSATLGPSPKPSHGPPSTPRPKKTKPPFFPPF
ncbi:MAG TPA: hypothetical protein VKI99_14540, partial [Candidatus Dormibacteraeota bacterium]|nr:hypothetical protein [Candidatus Dormibacteraeota bacterium]